ncbi:ABC transporter ATP-binding protein [Lachnospiraceae bacterium ZAX-1]
MALYDVREIEVIYGKGDLQVQAVASLSMQIEEKETVAVTGPSGAGKSTLLYALSGLEKVTSGEVFYQGDDIARLTHEELAKLRLHHFGFVFQSFHLLSDMTVRDNIWLPAIMKGGTVDMELFHEIIADLKLEEQLEHLAGQLSGGEQQRASIARALMNKPKVLFADEPTGNLDSANGAKVFELLFLCAKKYGQTLVYVTHDKEKAQMAERQVVMKDGALVE